MEVGRLEILCMFSVCSGGGGEGEGVENIPFLRTYYMNELLIF